MTTAYVLTNNACPNSRAFNCPILAARAILAEMGVVVRVMLSACPRLPPIGTDAFLINSNVFRPWWARRRGDILDFLRSARPRARRILWFDTTDSTWITQAAVLPHVDRFLKSQVLRDVERYAAPFRTGRIFTDAFDALYNAGERAAPAEPPDMALLRERLGLSWNTCFENYTESRFSLRSRLRQAIRGFIPLPERFNVPFADPRAPRGRPVTCRIGMAYDRPSVAAHRRAVAEAVRRRGVDCGKIPLPDYFAEMRASRVGVGPFGVGEITLRDFEIIICGAALLKPDMGHMRTWPELFIPGVTYQPHAWDLSDFDSALDSLLADDARRLAMAKAASDAYSRALSRAGMLEFARRLAAEIAGG